MAYKAKILHFKTKNSYNTERNKTLEGTDERKVFDAYLSFIDEGPTICTWGKEYKCELSLEDVEYLIQSKGFVTIDDIPDIPAASNNTPRALGNAYVGDSPNYAREDHVHPKPTSAETATKLEYARIIELTGSVTGSASFDGSRDITINNEIANIDASKITSGTIDIERLPKGALERLVIVENQEARFALTSEDVQEGDTVKQEDTGVMYFVVNIDNLSSEAGYKVYTAGAATSVPWSGVTEKPEFLQLGETSTTAYAGDKGKLNKDILDSLNTTNISDINNSLGTNGVQTFDDYVGLNFIKKTRSDTSKTFGTGTNVKLSIPAATQEKAGVMSAADKTALDTMEFSSINLIDGSESMTSVHIKKTIFGSFKKGDQYSISVENIENVVGSPTEYICLLYAGEKSLVASNVLTLKPGEVMSGVLTANRDAEVGALWLYAGPLEDNSGNTVCYHKVMLVHGNHPSKVWVPSVNDQKQAAIDDIQVGGVNLLNGSYSGKGWEGITRISDGVFEKDNSTASEDYMCSPYSLNLEAGKEYILSFYYKCTGNVKSVGAHILFEGASIDNKGQTIPNVTEWEYYSYIFTPTVSGVRQVRVDNDGSSDGNISTVYIKNVQVEEGNKATSWFPSYNDIQSNIGSSIFTITSEDLSGGTVTDEVYNGLLNAINSNIPIYMKYVYGDVPILLPILTAANIQGRIILRIDLSILGGTDDIVRFNFVINKDKSITEEDVSVHSEVNLPIKPTQYGSAGTSRRYSKGDHAHPEQTSIAGKDIATQEWVLQQLADYVSKSGDSTISGTLTAIAFKES